MAGMTKPSKVLVTVIHATEGVGGEALRTTLEAKGPADARGIATAIHDYAKALARLRGQKVAPAPTRVPWWERR